MESLTTATALGDATWLDESVTPAAEESPPAAEGAAAAEAAPSFEALNARISEQQAELTKLTERLGQSEKQVSDTFRWAQNERDARLRTEALVQSQEQQRQAWVAQQEAQRRLQPPTLTAEQEEQYLTDPKFAAAYNAALAHHHASLVEAKLAPVLQRAETVYALSQAQLEIDARQAWREARELAPQFNIPEEEFDALVNDTYEVMRQTASRSGDPLHLTRLNLNPQAIAMSAQMAYHARTGGAPVERQRPPRSAGSGEPTPAKPKTPEMPDFLRALHARGVKIDPKQIEAYKKKAEVYGANL